MATVTDADSILKLLESNSLDKAQEIKAVLYENLNANPKDSLLINGLVDYYLNSSSYRCLEVLIEIREPHDKHLFDKLNDCLKTPLTRMTALMLLGEIVCKQPSWLYKIANHSLFSTLIRLLQKSETDVHVLLTALLDLVNLLPTIPSLVQPNLMNIFEIFSRLAAWNITKPGNIPEIYVLHLHAGVYALFHRLYGMYPCNFLSYLRAHYGNRENLSVFAEIIRPMLERVRMHPMLVTASKDAELSVMRWKHMETHDVVMECAKVSLDIFDGFNNDVALSQPYEQQPQSAMELQRTTSSMTTCSSSFIVLDSQALLSHKMQQTTTTDCLKSSRIGLTVSTTEASEYAQSSIVSSPLSASMSGKSFVELSTNLSQPSSPLRKVGSASKFSPWNEDVKKDLIKSSPACRALQFSDCSVEEKIATGKFVNSRSTEIEESQQSVDDDTDKEVCDIVNQGKRNSFEDSGREDQFLERSYQRSDSVIHDEAEGIQVDDYDETTDTSFNQVADFFRKVSRMRYYSHTGPPPDLSQLQLPKPKLKRSLSCPLVTEINRQQDEENKQQIKNSSQAVSSAIVTIKTKTNETENAGESSESAQLKSDQATSVVLQRPESLMARINVPYKHFMLPALPMTMTTCYNQCQNCRTLGAVLFQPSPIQILDRHIELSSNVHAKELAAQKASLKLTPTAHSAAPPKLDDSNIVKGQVMLLHNQLLFERQRRSVHCERNRSLLAKLKKARAADEQNLAMKDQLKLQEKDIQNTQYEYNVLAKKMSQDWTENFKELEQLRVEISILKEENENLHYTNNNFQSQLYEKEKENEKIKQEVEINYAKFQTVTLELEDLQKKLSKQTKLQIELDQAKKELLLMGELQQKYREKFSSNSAGSTNESNYLLESCKAELQDTKQTLELINQSAEMLKACSNDLESQLTEKEMVINEQKELLQKTKEEFEEKVRYLEEQNHQTQDLVTQLLSYINTLNWKQQQVDMSLPENISGLIIPLREESRLGAIGFDSSEKLAKSLTMNVSANADFGMNPETRRNTTTSTNQSGPS